MCKYTDVFGVGYLHFVFQICKWNFESLNIFLPPVPKIRLNVNLLSYFKSSGCLWMSKDKSIFCINLRMTF